MHRIYVLLLTAIALTLASCDGGGEPSRADPAATATPETTPTPTATVAAATATPSPAIEVTTPITAHTVPSPTATTQPATATTAPTTSTAPPPPPPPTATPTTPPPPAANNPMSATVGVSGSARFFWSPAKVTIAPGGSVTWAWSGNDFHDVHVEALGYVSGNPAKQGSYTLAFPTAGTYAVSCSIHPDTMRGTVTVE